MAQYTKLTRSDIQKIARIYNLDVLEFEPVTGGASNSSFILHTPNSKLVLTIFDNKSPLLTHRVARTLKLLYDNDFPATPIKTTASGDVTAIYKNQPIMLKTFVPGKVCRDLSENMLRQTGAALAKLHEIPPPDFLPKDHCYNTEIIPLVLKQKHHPEFHSWLSRRRTRFYQVIPESLPRGVIHGDLFYDNILFKNELLSAIIDFEDVCDFYKTFDLGMAAIGLCLKNGNLSTEKTRALISGYQDVRKLESAEKSALQICIEFAAAATSAWRFWKYRIDDPASEKGEKYLEMVTLARAIDAIPEAVFQEKVFSGGNRS